MQFFLRLSLRVEEWCSHPSSVVAASLLLLLWLAGGLILGFSEGYITVGTFLISVPPYLLTFFLLVAQSRYNVAMNLKLDEIVRALDKADNRFVAIERSENVERLR